MKRLSHGSSLREEQAQVARSLPRNGGIFLSFKFVDVKILGEKGQNTMIHKMLVCIDKVNIVASVDRGIGRFVDEGSEDMKMSTL